MRYALISGCEPCEAAASLNKGDEDNFYPDSFPAVVIDNIAQHVETHYVGQFVAQAELGIARMDCGPRYRVKRDLPHPFWTAIHTKLPDHFTCAVVLCDTVARAEGDAWMRGMYPLLPGCVVMAPVRMDGGDEHGQAQWWGVWLLPAYVSKYPVSPWQPMHQQPGELSMRGPVLLYR
jgi:hypothetical protein